MNELMNDRLSLFTQTCVNAHGKSYLEAQCLKRDLLGQLLECMHMFNDGLDN